MAIQYHVYANDGAGGPVDTVTPVATVSGLSWLSPALLPGSDWTWLVRAYDTVSGLEERNLTAKVRVKLDGSGNDVTNVPNPPRALSARPRAGGSLRVDWVYVANGQAAAPSGFRVWLTAGGSVDYGAAPAATVPAHGSNPIRRYSATLSGLTDGATYSVGVRSYNASGAETNTVALTVVGSSVPPADVQDLAGSAVSRG